MRISCLLQNPAYFLRFLDILRSPAGRPLLDTLAASEEQLVAILNAPQPPSPGGGPRSSLGCCSAAIRFAHDCHTQITCCIGTDIVLPLMPRAVAQYPPLYSDWL